MQDTGNHLNISGNQNEEGRTGSGRNHHHPYQQQQQHVYPQPSTHDQNQNQHYLHQQPQQQSHQQQQQQIAQSSQSSGSITTSRREKKLKLERDGTILSHRCTDSTGESPMEGVELSRKTPASSPPSSDCASSGGSTTSNNGTKKGKRGKKSLRVDLNAKLERSRQSARECRARKKLRYQYLEDLVNKREKAVFSLRKELDTYKDWCKQVDDGANPKEALVSMHLDKKTDFLKPT